MENGALTTVTASQISHGRENDLFIEVDGTKGSLEWHQEEPNKMLYRRNGHPLNVYTRNPGAPFMNAAGNAASRLPGGHPEAFFEAFANVYRFAYDNMALRRGQGIRTHWHDLPQRQRRRRRDVLHPTIRRQQPTKRRLAAAKAPAGT